MHPKPASMHMVRFRPILEAIVARLSQGSVTCFLGAHE